ncbi:hypothetical protein IEQ34_012700 [Dendrobium chrysotoxum]|uniref:Methyltransferase n=1 Tax=Dendrobium chrysotoxum TaxID=161865 RepID=A0AAV7GPH0_DENCH|nr:hypothetical protein IEQ34_012700 [Dendrobium chrysotoxum]
MFTLSPIVAHAHELAAFTARGSPFANRNSPGHASPSHLLVCHSPASLNAPTNSKEWAKLYGEKEICEMAKARDRRFNKCKNIKALTNKIVRIAELESMPDIAWGKWSCIVLDICCGVASLGGYILFQKMNTKLNTMRFALERGILAISYYGHHNATIPSRVLDVIHCAHCRVPWHIEDQTVRSVPWGRHCPLRSGTHLGGNKRREREAAIPIRKIDLIN